MSAWIATLEIASLDERFGSEAVDAALAGSRRYVDPPAVDPAGRIAASVIVTTSGKLHAPLRVVVRVRDEVLDLGCACRSARVCGHVVGLLVDVAIHPPLRNALARGESATLEARPRLRVEVLEQRTLEQRLAMWLPPRTARDDFEIDLEVLALTDGAVVRSALLLRHRTRGSRALVAARDVLGSRLPPAHRNLVDLCSPYHADRNALVATRGQASLLVHLVTSEIGIRTEGFKELVRFEPTEVHPAVTPDEERLVALWRSSRPVAVASEAFVFAGAFPFLWVPRTRTFYPIAKSVDLDAAVGMQNVPSLPLGRSKERVGRALLVRGRGLGVAMPAPETFGLPALDVPTFELRLTGSPLDVTGELQAIYSVGKILVTGAGDPTSLTIRDDESEARALSALRAAGLSFEGGVLSAKEDDAVHLWGELDGLRGSFAVLLSAQLARVKVGPPVAVDVRVKASAGWLDTELEFRAGALVVEIDRLHRALVDRQGWVVLEDGTLARLTDEVAALVGAADGVHLPSHQLGRVLRHEGEPTAGIRVHLETVELRCEPTEPRLPARLEATLRPYQRVGLAWLQRLRAIGAGGLLADDMGLGKTLTTLAFLARAVEEGETKPTLVVCPTSVVGNWLREAARFTPQLRVHGYTGAQRKLSEGNDVFVTSYGVLRRDIEMFASTRFACVVLDEAQNIKNPSVATARAARKLVADTRLALSGTPVENRLAELWSLMTFLNPGMLGTAADFDRRYEVPIAARPDGAVAAELRAVVKPFVLRRRKEDVLVDLPPKIDVERACTFGRTQKRLYDALALSLRQAVSRRTEKRKGARTQLSVLTAILRLRQMACDPRLVEPDVAASESAKRLVFLDLVRELVSERRRALVFSQFTSLFDLWRADLDAAKVAYEVLDGSTSGRDEVVRRFQEGDAPLFLVSLKAGGTGLNLTAADTVIHCDPWWNPAAEDQATDRAHRIGQTRPVTVVRLVARGTIEDKIALLKRDKQELAASVLGGDSLRGTLTEEDLGVLLGNAPDELDELDDDPPGAEGAVEGSSTAAPAPVSRHGCA